MFHFTIRDLLWLTLVVAVGLGWFVHHRQLRAVEVCANAEHEAKCLQLNDKIATWRGRAGALAYFLESDGVRLKWKKDSVWADYPDKGAVSRYGTGISFYACEQDIPDDD